MAFAVFVGGRCSTRDSYVGGGNLDLNSIVLVSKSWIILLLSIRARLPIDGRLATRDTPDH